MDYTRLPVCIVCLSLAAVLWAGQNACGADTRPDRNLRPLVVVHSNNTPPLSFCGLNGSPKGILYDFWSAWSEATGVPVRFVQADWPDCQRMVREGLADVHGGLYANPERSRYLDFTEPLFSQKATLFVRASLGVKNVKELAGLTVGVLREGYSDYWLREHLPGLKRRLYNNSGQMVEGALAGEVDAMLTEYATLVHQLGAAGQYKSFEPLGTMYERQLRGAAAKGTPELLEVLNRGIRDMGEEGRMKILQRWVVHEDGLPSWLWPALGVGAMALLFGLGSVLVAGRQHG